MKRFCAWILAVSCAFLASQVVSHQVNAAGATDETAQVDQVVVTHIWTLPANLTLRARVTHIEPDQSFVMSWRHSGEGLGGEAKKGDFLPSGYVPSKGPEPRTARDRQAARPQFKVGQWSEAVNLKQIAPARPPAMFFLTVTAGEAGQRSPEDAKRRLGHAVNVQFEFELVQAGKTLKRLTANGVMGGTVTVVFPFEKIPPTAEVVPAEFVEGVCDLLTYVQRRGQMLKDLSWSDRPLPRKFRILTDVNGHGESMGYAIRHTDPAIIEQELANVREFGVNGVRGATWYVQEMIEKADNPLPAMRTVAGFHNLGYPSPLYRKGRNDNDPEAGCPYAPGVAERQQQNIDLTLAMLSKPYEEIWSLTVDEIGAVVDMSLEGKAHLSICPRCIGAYREYVKGKGLSPADLGVTSFDQLQPINVWERNSEKAWLQDAKASLNAYYSRLFINHASAQLFTPLRNAVAKANAAKQAAVDAGDYVSAVARQPWLYTFALRGNTFLMRGHSLDFFDFYRLADNGFVHETSNRDPRVLGWDSYLLDVGRTMSAEQNLALGLYVKPHRGAPIQRAIAAASRGAQMIFWYTYGPDYAKGDSFSERFDHMAATSKAARLLAAAEDHLWLARDVSPAQAAIIKPKATEVWMQFTADNATTASWEDAKFTYTALTDSHVPLDPLDETLVMTRDLSSYRTIHLLGTHHARQATRKLLQWVDAGGTLVLHAGAMSRDEANQPLSEFHAQLGVKDRQPVEMWKNIQNYVSTRLHPLNDRRAILAAVPEHARVSFVSGPLAGREAMPVIGREVLDPLPGARVLARYADGAAAVIEHDLGRGKVVLLGLFAGLEYTAPQRDIAYAMRRDIEPLWREASAGIAQRKVDRPVWSDVTGLEIRRIINAQGQRSLPVMNWAYEVTGTRVREVDGRARSGYMNQVSALADLKITLPDAQGVNKVRSAWLQHELPLERQADGSVVITLPVLEEADVLLLE